MHAMRMFAIGSMPDKALRAYEAAVVVENQLIAGTESVCLATDTGCRLLSPVPVEVFIHP